MQDKTPDSLIAAFERHYDTTWDTPSLRNERLAWKACWEEATKPCLVQIQEPAPHPSHIEQPLGMVLNALLQSEAALEVAIARILKADPSHSISVTSEAKALVAVRAALAATPAATAQARGGELNQFLSAAKDAGITHLPMSFGEALRELEVATGTVVLPEPVAAESRFTSFSGDRWKWCTVEHAQAFGQDKGYEVRYLYTEQQVRALLATATGLPAQAVEPTDAALLALNAGEFYFSESPSKFPEAGHGTQYHAGAPGVIAFGHASIALSAEHAAHTQTFQRRVWPWMMECFGPEISADVSERNHRFFEEALELVQACGCTASEAHQLVDYVFGRPMGDKQQEVGGVMVTLAALCLAQGLDMHAAGDVELARIWTKVEAIRAKQAAKPKHSPLPMHAPQAQDVGRGEVLVTVSGFTGSGKSAIAGEIEILCRALGLQVDWPGGDSEKNMTHADWTAALEQYKPRVRIVEHNVPTSESKNDH